MSEYFKGHKVFSLLEITQSIQRAFQKWYSDTYWIKAEMNKLNYYKYSGHCYPDLLERKQEKIVAQIRATLWDIDYQRINSTFLKVLNEPLKDGINILFLAKISFTPLHGLSLSILDIDPSYTLGDLEREKLNTINRLKSSNIFDQNKRLQASPLIQRLAIISVETSKGLSDFMKIINDNRWGYRFFTMLFPALLQGDKAPESIMGQLRRINRVKHHFDAVAIIRGGGGDIGLTSYNNFQLAHAVATFPLPVLTGIGHSTNETVTEMVAHINAITPTELADFLIQKYRNFDIPVTEAAKRIKLLSQQKISSAEQKLKNEMRFFKSVAEKKITTQSEVILSKIQQIRQNIRSEYKVQLSKLEALKLNLNKHTPSAYKNEFDNNRNLKLNLKKNSGILLKNFSNEILSTENQLRALHPDNVLKRGFSITLLNGKALTKANNASVGDEVETILFKGAIKSKITHKSINKDHG